MLWIIGALVIIFLAFGAAGVRAALKVAAIFIVAVIAFFIIYSGVQKNEQEASKNRIALSEVELNDLRLGIGSSGKLTGTVRNRSLRYTLSGVDLQITLRDCIQQNCDTVGQENTSLWGLNVPPGQIRAVNGYVSFANLPPQRGEYRWDYQIKSVRGE